jgi:hypothetical protein
MPLAAIVTLALAGTAAVLAYRDEKLGAAILVGAAVLTALYLLLGAAPDADGGSEMPVPLTTRTSSTPSEPPVSP